VVSLPPRPGDNDDAPAGELVLHAKRPHLDDARVHMPVGGDDPRLTAREADRVASEIADGDRQQRHRDALAGGEQHVELAPVGIGRHLLGEREQVVRGPAHRGDDHDDAVSGGARAHHARGDAPNARDVRHAGAAVLLDDDGHRLFEKVYP
jgi:hypothetical protein